MAENQESLRRPEDLDVKPLSDEEIEGSFDPPAIYANRFFVTVGPSGTRITFADQRSPDNKIHFRNAVMMSHPDAMALWKLLKKMIAPIEEAISAAESVAKGKSDG